MKTTALALNLLVAGIGTIQFWRMGLLSLRTFYPFAVLGFPFSLIGGAVQLPSGIYYPVVGSILLLSAVQMVRSARRADSSRAAPPDKPPFIPALATGAVIGFISGTTGTGGGIFLAPVILSMNWVSLQRHPQFALWGSGGRRPNGTTWTAAELASRAPPARERRPHVGRAERMDFGHGRRACRDCLERQQGGPEGDRGCVTAPLDRAGRHDPCR